MQRVITTLAQITIDNPFEDTPDVSDGSIATLLAVFFGIMAAVSVLIIVIASIQFALSRGDSSKAARARNTIIYTAVGLAIAVGAQAIIQFVIGNV